MAELDPEVVLGMAAQAPDGIVIIDGEGLIRYWNRGAERIFGFSAADVAGRSLDVIIPEKHRKRHWDGFQTAMDRGATKYGEADLLTVPALAADGSTLSIEFSVALLTGADGAAHVGAVIRDVTARRAREREMMRRRAETTADRTTV
ncbi:signal transduction histidine kinase [Streptomyces albiflavescens]|uniref:Signal transduction histidine kinase n=1 Tax=Streptomyces albiflavescens TaxID=1623582 RepID=A0A917YDY9_9ACTN|nr:PAS domain S-box protein [Streptomyces albiflavescens]GGN86583.1 signal transduction histidine kinase [Streptomyces albiflavescens]